jgi:hypothetical protein
VTNHQLMNSRLHSSSNATGETGCCLRGPRRGIIKKRTGTGSSVDGCLSICLYIYIYLSICLSVYLSIYLSICLSIYLSFYLFIYLSTCIFLLELGSFFSFLIFFTQSVGVISSSQGRHLRREQHKQNKRAQDIHASNGIRTHDPSV